MVMECFALVGPEFTGPIDAHLYSEPPIRRADGVEKRHEADFNFKPHALNGAPMGAHKGSSASRLAVYIQLEVSRRPHQAGYSLGP